MLAVAVLLLPGLGLLLFTMTHIEDRLLRGADPAERRPRRHLRLLPGGRQTPAGHGTQRGRHAA
ncbi:hypothetical protein GCM10010129_02910 [Streptomyces fumigatiscleroticus]|nr:hypothetical protein GCM10010129_02910 [Streptomyces fumigatiscleroticus]